MNLLNLFKKPAASASAAAAKQPKWNDLEQALLKSITENAKDWQITRLQYTSEIRCFNPKIQVATTFDFEKPHSTFSGLWPFHELGHAVSAEFKETFRDHAVVELGRQMHERRAAAQKQAEAGIRRALGLN